MATQVHYSDLEYLSRATNYHEERWTLGGQSGYMHVEEHGRKKPHANAKAREMKVQKRREGGLEMNNNGR